MPVEKQLWVPGQREVKFVCKVPTGDGPCGEVFLEGDERGYQAHVAQCVKDNHDHAVEALHEARPPGFFKPFDPEFYEHARKTGDYF